MGMDRRTFIAATAALAAAPKLGATRERRIGWGRRGLCIDPDPPLVHETFAIERWDGERWVDTYQRREWWYRDGNRVERTWRLTQIEIDWLKGRA